MQMKNYLLILLLIMCNQSKAESIILSCAGTNYGEFKSFDINVNSSTGEMWGFPGYVAPGCIRIDKIKDSMSDKFSATSSTVETSCANNIWTSFLRLSRTTGNLNVSTYDLKKKKSEGEYFYQCKKMATKIF